MNESMRRWAWCLHFYQPGTQEPEITMEVYRKCYLPLVEEIEKRDRVRVTINLTGSLAEQLPKEFSVKLGELVKLGKVELLNTPMHHPLIPITPWSVVERQIGENKRVLGDRELVVGDSFFPPELGVDKRSYRDIRKLGYKAILTDEIQDHEICEIVRAYPERLSGRRLAEYVKRKYPDGETLISVHDAEVFGHHYEERLEVLKELWADRDFEFVILGGVQRLASSVQNVRAGTWQDTKGFDLWTGNSMQKRYLELGMTATNLFDKYGGDKWAARHLDVGWSSCHLYWLSNQPWWHPDIAVKGAENLIKCVRTLSAGSEEKIKAEKQYHSLLLSIWKYHWSGKVEKGFKKYESARMGPLVLLKNLYLT